MKKEEYLKKIDSLNLDKEKYCIISGGVLLLYGIKDKTEDIDIKVLPDYFDELNKKYHFNKSPKYDYLYELGDDIELAKLPFSKEDIIYVDGYPVESLEKQLEWMEKNKREKDKDKIEKIKVYLRKKNTNE
ncbi:MAG: hypothetical protein IKE70_06350 [Bacilli bacterium]|nr:hypothetical protein [Bacilli bacterium]